MAPFLPTDCLSQIFRNLETDQESLYSCILVNRLWCATSIEFLWSRPFRFLYTCPNPSACKNDSRIERSSKLIQVYLSCLNEKEKFQLKENKVYLPLSVQQSPLFDYAGFIRYLDLDEFYTAIKDWIEFANVVSKEEENREAELRKKSKKSNKKLNLSTVVKFFSKSMGHHNKRKSESDKESVNSVSTGHSSVRSVGGNTPPPSPIIPHPRERLITESLCGLFMRRSVTLKQLSIDKTHSTRSKSEPRCISLSPWMDKYRIQRFIPDQYLSLPTYPGANNCLSHLNEFIFTTRQSKTKLFDSLCKISHNMHTIVVTMDHHYNGWCGTRSRRDVVELEDEAKSLANLIKAQQSLQTFELHQCEFGSKVIIQSLQTQSKSLKSLCFDEVSFWGWDPLTPLEECTQLQNLVFRGCHGLTSELLEPLISTKFDKLLSLLMDASSAPAHILDAIIKNSGHRIQTLNLGMFKPNPTVHLIETVATYCPNLTTFCTYVDNDETNHLVALFTLCTKLSSVTLTGQRNSETNVDKMFLQLARQDLSNLKELNILGPWSFSPEALDKFLTFSKAPIRTLRIDNCRCFTDHHLDVIIRCLKNTLEALRLNIRNRLNEDSIIRAKELVDLEIEKLEYVHRVSNDDNNNHGGIGGSFKPKFCKMFLTERRLKR
ncbi:19547_t:CDS:1 [Funneliformis geosporum]|uniref:1696_t:CDS:1 n=1 Tax=Funneliformis geosporum TaxID=1117311 RepID=A0A9W4WTR7_9GLOM|nr:19547_t:CDS:1 [Funneliformis geosporum]CAI2178317.1 1696_t:CDS:1 [Funneliformis geosporum]